MMPEQQTVLVYEGQNLLEKSILLKIKALEDEIKSLDEWKQVCLAQSITDESCHDAISFVSPLSFLGSLDVQTAT